MSVLTGSNLNQRHRELNTKVNEAAKNNIKFEDVMNASEQSDIDVFFKIDLASKYKNIDYILEVIKKSDTLHASRALKCDWIGDDEFSQYMSPQYLDTNMFPYMSTKMKNKLLTALSARIRNGERAEAFHHYCIGKRMYKLAVDFLLYTNESFKTEILIRDSKTTSRWETYLFNDLDRKPEHLKQFIGDSFIRAEHYLKFVPDSARPKALHLLRHLYSVSQEGYLDLMEAFQSAEQKFQVASRRLSQRIMNKHKKRVLQNPWLYLNTLVKTVVTKCSTSEDAKVYAVPFLRDKNFWDNNYYKENEYFLQLIPLGERFDYIKKIVKEKYPDELFDHHIHFFHYSCYNMMTLQEKEDWAIYHAYSEEELFGLGCDYIWYQFVHFERALEELQDFILVNSNPSVRSNILGILLTTVKTDKDIAAALEYYYNRHVNELKMYKITFINTVISDHKVFDFNEECWGALEKLFYSLDIYNKQNASQNDYDEMNRYRLISLVYHTVHGKHIPEVFYDFVIGHIIAADSVTLGFVYDFDAKKKDIVYQYMLQCFSNHLESLVKVNDNVLETLNDILNLVSGFYKSVDDVPKNIHDHITQHFEELKDHKVFTNPFKDETDANQPHVELPTLPKFRISDIMHYLKEDASLVVSNFQTIKQYLENEDHKSGIKARKTKISWLIHKLKIYFHNDVAQEYVKLLNECLSVKELHVNIVRAAVYGILYLSKEENKVDFLKKYAPIDEKIDQYTSRNLLTIQKAICSLAGILNPPLPVSSIRDYIKGDYLRFCAPIFDLYLAQRTPMQCLPFTESLPPMTIQKHRLRLAFHCFSTENFKTLVLNDWKETTNTFQRKVLYKALFGKVDYYHDNLTKQRDLFEALTIMTRDLNQDDDEKVFELLAAELPPSVIGQHLQSAFAVVNTFKKIERNYKRLIGIVEAIKRNLESIPESALLTLATDYINSASYKRLILNSDKNNANCELVYHSAMWSLIETVIIKHKNIVVLHIIWNKCRKKWYKIYENEYVYRKFWTQFMYDLDRLSYQEKTEEYLAINNIFEAIMGVMKKSLPLKQIFVVVWKLQFNILTRQAFGENVTNVDIDRETAKTLAKETGLKFSRMIAELVKECLDTKRYKDYFVEDVEDIIVGLIKEVEVSLNRSFTEIETVDINVLLCSVLIEHDILGLNVFAMNLLPKDYRGIYSKEYDDIICKLNVLDDEEIKCLLCHKFYSSDYLYRDFMP